MSAGVIQRGALLLCGVLIASSGCAIVPFRHKPLNPTIPMTTETAVDTIAVMPTAPPDTLEQTSQTPTPHPHPHPSKPAASPTPQKPPESPPTPPPSAEKEPDRSISVEMPEATRAQLDTSCRADLTSAEKTLSELIQRTLAQDDLERVETVKGLLAQARAALDQQDLQAAANLAHKGRVLADEIAAR